MPSSVANRAAWASDLQLLLAALKIEPSDANVCAVLAVTEQESTFRADPAVPNLAKISRDEIFKRADDAGVPAVVAANPQFNPFLGLRGLQFIPPYLNVPNGVEDGRTSDSDFAYTARLNYKFNDNLNIYATHATGFKASSINLSFDARPPAALFIPGSTAQSPAPAASPIRTALGANLPVNLTTGSRSANPEHATVYELGI
jgi:outer membrane receptor protein involved in Fe transport